MPFNPKTQEANRTSLANMQFDEIADCVADAIAEFLNHHGGLSNGYLTWVEYNGPCAELNWSTPDMEDLTFGTIRNKARELLKTINTIAAKHHVQVFVTKQHLEDGCFRTSVLVGREQEVRLK